MIISFAGLKSIYDIILHDLKNITQWFISINKLIYQFCPIKIFPYCDEL